MKTSSVFVRRVARSGTQPWRDSRFLSQAACSARVRGGPRSSPNTNRWPAHRRGRCQRAKFWRFFACSCRSLGSRRLAKRSPRPVARSGPGLCPQLAQPDCVFPSQGLRARLSRRDIADVPGAGWRDDLARSRLVDSRSRRCADLVRAMPGDPTPDGAWSLRGSTGVASPSILHTRIGRRLIATHFTRPTSGCSSGQSKSIWTQVTSAAAHSSPSGPARSTRRRTKYRPRL